MSWTEIDKNDNDSHELYVKFLDILKGMTENYSKNLSTKILYDINHKDTARSFVYIDGETEMCLSISIKNNGKLKVLTTGISEETPINIAVGIFCNKLKEVLLQNKLTTAYGKGVLRSYFEC
jgi:viroplasmin and RNaseH domain-containing protein